MSIQIREELTIVEQPSNSRQHPAASQTNISLFQLVNQLMEGLLPAAVKRGSLIINDIPRELSIGADENMVAYVLWNLLDSAVTGTRNECINIVAMVNEEYTTIRVKDVGTCFYKVISHNYRQLQWVAEKIGGSISLEEDRNEASVSFRITNNLLAA